VSIASTCAELVQVLARPESGIRSAHAQPPEVLGALPAAMVVVNRGAVAYQSGDLMWTYTLDVVVYVTPRISNLPAEYARVAPLINSVVDTVWRAYEEGDAYGQTVSRCVVRDFTAGVRDFAGKPHHSITFSVDVKEHTA